MSARARVLVDAGAPAAIFYNPVSAKWGQIARRFTSRTPYPPDKEQR